jgi:hypothetical protein
LPTQTRRSFGGFVFWEERSVDLDEHPIAPWLPIFCLECGDELILSPSGHQLCANHLCRDGFDIRLMPQFAMRRGG